MDTVAVAPITDRRDLFQDKPTPIRLSRHYYDIMQVAASQPEDL